MKTRSLALALTFASAAALAAAPEPDYNPIGRRDPFQPQLPAATPAPASTLERVDLESITLEGIISGIGDPRATVTVPGGESFLVRRGMRIGRAGGRIARITTDQVVIAEEQRDANGVLHVRETSLSLRPAE